MARLQWNIDRCRLKRVYSVMQKPRTTEVNGRVVRSVRLTGSQVKAVMTCSERKNGASVRVVACGGGRI